MPKEILDVFISYSHEDETLREELDKHLALLRREGHIRPWHDRQLVAGKEWRGKIDEGLETADVILLLVSASFIASDFCWSIETERALERHASGNALVIPIVVRPCEWETTQLAKLQALPTGSRAVTDWPSSDQAWSDVARGLRSAIAHHRVQMTDRDSSEPTKRLSRTWSRTGIAISLTTLALTMFLLISGWRWQSTQPLPEANTKMLADPGEHHTSDEKILGYDLVLVIDSTAGMERWFKPIANALRTFAEWQRQLKEEEAQPQLRVGLLFYRDRATVLDCDIGYFTRWAAPLASKNLEYVIAVLEQEREARCRRDDPTEAVYDALNRAMLDPAWRDNNFKAILLLGDAPPHPSYYLAKNPLRLEVEDSAKIAFDRNIRILAFKIGLGDDDEFKLLAQGLDETVHGRFRYIKTEASMLEGALFLALREEWTIVHKANAVAASGISALQLTQPPSEEADLD